MTFTVNVLLKESMPSQKYALKFNVSPKDTAFSNDKLTQGSHHPSLRERGRIRTDIMNTKISSRFEILRIAVTSQSWLTLYPCLSLASGNSSTSDPLLWRAYLGLV